MLDPPPPAPVRAHQKKPPLLSLLGAGASSLHSEFVFQTDSTPVGYVGFWASALCRRTVAWPGGIGRVRGRDPMFRRGQPSSDYIS
jgi:hypothetical protein